MVVGFSSLKKSAESGTNRWSPGPRVRKHYRCGGIEATRGSGGIPQNCSFQAWSTYLWDRDVGIDAAREEALSTFSGLLRRGSGYGGCRQHRRWEACRELIWWGLLQHSGSKRARRDG